MKRLGLFAFGVTTCVLVPTTLHLLQAGPNQVAKLVAADQTSIEVDGAKIDISTDKGLVEPGGKVRVTLSATADTRVKVPLAVLVYEQEGMGPGRTENPPVRVGRDEVTLDVRDGKASKTFAFTLRGNNRTWDMESEHPFGHYTVLVMSVKAADALVGSHRDANEVLYELRDGDGSASAKLGPVARLDINTPPVSDHIQILSGDLAQNGDVAVKVRVRNPTRRAFAEVELGLTVTPGDITGQYLGIGSDNAEVVANPDATFAMKPHETKDVVFHVHTTQTGTLGLYVDLKCKGDDCFPEKGETAAKLNDSMLDAIDIVPSEAGSAVAVADGGSAKEQAQ